MKTYRFVLLGWLLLCTTMLTGCAQSQPPKKKVEKLTTFPIPELPPVMSADPEARAEYMVAHYWERYPFADTSLISNKAVTEQGFADFIYLLPYVKPEVAQKALTKMMDSAQTDSAVYNHFVRLTERYLYDPNSPYRNDEYYIPVLDQIIGSTMLDDLNKTRPIYIRKMVQKNRIGTKAADFDYTLPNGKRGRLYDIHASYTVLFFNNPDCHQCGIDKQYIATSAYFERWLTAQADSLRIEILALYPDKDIELWKKTDYPKGWINGSNPHMANGQTYDVRAIPSFYLLDKEKRVVLKDVQIDQIEQYLSQIR